MQLGEKNREIRANPEINCSFLRNLYHWNMHLGCSVRSGTAIKTVMRESHRKVFFSASSVPAGPSPIECNSRPVMTQNGLKGFDKDSKIL